MTKQTKKPSWKAAVSRALQESMIAYGTNAGTAQYYIEQDMDALIQLELIINTVAVISTTHKPLYTLKTNKYTGHRYVQATMAGKALHMCLKSPVDEIFKYFCAHTFNPRLEAFMTALKQHGVDGMPVYDLSSYGDEAAEDWVTRVNAVATSIQMATSTAEFKTAIRKSQRSCNKNFRSLCQYMRNLSKKHGRMLGLRVDFGYKKTNNFDGAGVDVPYEEAKYHREALVDEIRELFKDYLVGYAWKFEYGLLKGYHTHGLIFLDGSKVREDVTLAKMLGERWSSQISEGKGVYFNCNAKKESYRFCGIGVIRHDDPVIWQGLENIATYLTKPDYYVKLNMLGNDRAFGKGGPPRQHTKALGRPRKSAEPPASSSALGPASIPPPASPPSTP